MGFTSPYQRYLAASKMTDDPTLRWWYQRQMIMDELNEEKELDRIADKVIERLKITADVREVIESLDEIQKKLKELGAE